MKRLRVLVVDDEPPARGILRDLLERDPQVEVVGEAGDGATALRLARERRPDIVFLDVEMPEQGGLEVARELASGTPPAVVFVTAYSSYAPRAFEVAALDYLVKPFSDERFGSALERAKQRVRERRLSGLAEEVAEVAAALAEPAPESPYLSRIPVHGKDRSLLLKPEEVAWIGAEDYYCRLHTAGSSHLVRAALSWFEARLDPRRFLRIHRSALVNLDHVVAIERLLKGARAVVLSDGSRCRVSRSRLGAIEERLLPKLGGAP